MTTPVAVDAKVVNETTAEATTEVAVGEAELPEEAALLCYGKLESVVSRLENLNRVAGKFFQDFCAPIFK